MVNPKFYSGQRVAYTYTDMNGKTIVEYGEIYSTHTYTKGGDGGYDYSVQLDDDPDHFGTIIIDESKLRELTELERLIYG